MWYQQKQNKYGSKSTQYEGQAYDSKKEAAYAADLDLLVKGKIVKNWQRQVKFSFDICSNCKRLCSAHCEYHPKEKVRHLNNYYLDFLVNYSDGTIGLEEVKSQITMTDVWRQKWKMLEILYGDDERYVLKVIK